jgi:hypothetical protein
VVGSGGGESWKPGLGTRKRRAKEEERKEVQKGGGQNAGPEEERGRCTKRC